MVGYFYYKITEKSLTCFQSEEFLQHLIAEHPELLAGDQFANTSPRRFLLISREMGLASEEDGGDRWAIDHLFVDQDAILTVVEVKRSSDTRIRREVVGQMLDYASNAVVYLPIEKIRRRFERNHDEPEEQLREFVGDDVEYDVFWENVKTNLQAGKIRLLFVADEIPAELRRIIEFLNKHMSTVEVLAVEVKQYTTSYSGLTTLVPRVLGQTAETQRNKSTNIGTTIQLDEATFFNKVSALNEGEISVARRIYDWANRNVSWGRSSFIPIDSTNRYKLFAVHNTGKVEITKSSYKNMPPFDSVEMMQEFIHRLEGVDGFDLNRSCPKVSLSSLADMDNLKRFLDVFNWVQTLLSKLP